MKKVARIIMDMEEDQLQAYNSDSGEENVDIDALSDEIGAA